MALIHEKLYQSETLATVDFTDYADSLVRSVFRSYASPNAHIQLNISVGDLDLPLDLAIPCGLILNELVSNALKYAFADGDGRLDVSLHRSGDGCQLIVADDGVGLPDHIDVNTSKTLGLQLVNTLVAQIEGQLEVDADDGTTFRVSFPTAGP